jgi:ribose-phosphate pyrophosphokinase
MYAEEWDNPGYDHRLNKALEDVRLVAGSSHPELASQVASLLGMKVTDMGVSYFANTETRIQPTAEPESTFRGKRVFILQTGSASEKLRVNDHVIEVCLIMDACRRGGCKEINLLIPCYPYARQDKKDSSRAPISAAVVADMFKLRGVDRIVCFDLHNPAIQGFFPGCSDNLFVTKVMREWLMNNVFHATTVGDKSYTDRFVLIAPDAGAAPKVEKVATYLGLDILTMNKVRDYSTKNKVKSIQLQCTPEMSAGHTGDFLAGKTPIIVDDMADTCGTVIAAIEKLMSYGADGCIVAVTHGVFSGNALKSISECKGLKMLLTSDSLPQSANQAKCDKIQVYSIASSLAEVIRRTVTDKSFSSLMK